ncbi:MAG: hypothetical protein CVT84_16635 [Alphaproteobacteria bacterium HGW-Alphaproteobacteria-6]|nr:MAG: hypothetical protein CVT84_16635 [Alphaproteobacteria bacterium HGW-Alphaproteobacteria-6]
MTEPRIEADALPQPRRVGVAAIGQALRAGLGDFRAAPAFGLFFSAFYVAGGVAIWLVYAASGEEWWLIPFIAGFPLLAPFAAIGLYEVSRRIEAGEALDWGAVLGVVFSQKDRQVPSMAMVILLIFMFWVFVAHTIFALFLGLSAMTNVTSSLTVLTTGSGPLMLLVGTLVGAGFAAVLFAITVAGLPLLLDREVDFVSAMILSVRAVATNAGPMALWGAAIAALLFLGMLPVFLGLFLVLPVLGHATWHMYRQLLQD